eukprot:1806995-Prymnesium_polylepis.1
MTGRMLRGPESGYCRIALGAVVGRPPVVDSPPWRWTSSEEKRACDSRTRHAPHACFPHFATSAPLWRAHPACC